MKVFPCKSERSSACDLELRIRDVLERNQFFMEEESVDIGLEGVACLA